MFFPYIWDLLDKTKREVRDQGQRAYLDGLDCIFNLKQTAFGGKGVDSSVILSPISRNNNQTKQNKNPIDSKFEDRKHKSSKMRGEKENPEMHFGRKEVHLVRNIFDSIR